MTSIEELIKLVRAYNPNTNQELIRSAYNFGAKMHEGQTRKSGGPYFTHPIAVFEILAEQHLDDTTLIAALLHDTIEDTRASFEDVEKLFGSDIANVVDGVTKLTKIQIESDFTETAENIRKFFIATSRDLRVTLVKLADRLHNMRTIRFMSLEKREQKSNETLEIYAPLAGRLGMQSMREELEDLAFQVTNFNARASIIRRFVKLKDKTLNQIEQIEQDLATEMEQVGVKAQIQSRAKKPYSIWRKMEAKELTFSQLSDIYGFRLLLENKGDCYKALGAIHQRWSAVPGRFKDYISQPKDNGYRSLHTTVMGHAALRVEVQIRTHEMHQVAETGAAATWAYREGKRFENPYALDAGRWFDEMIKRLANDINHEEFMESVKMEIYSKQVFCFTPKAKVIQLPKGATPIDFAYAIHTDVGASCVSAKVDGVRVPLSRHLRNGETIQIITAQGQTPQKAWLDMVETGRAKADINKYLRNKERHNNINFGKKIVNAAFEKRDRKVTENALQAAAEHYSLDSSDELLFRLGMSKISAADVLNYLYPQREDHDGAKINFKESIIGLDPDDNFGVASCCQPLPGEPIVGISYPADRIVIIHRLNCENIASFEDQMERWMPVKWQEGEHAATHTVTLELTIRNGVGVLGNICAIIGRWGGNITDISFKDRKPDYFLLHIDIDIRDASQLHDIRIRLKSETDVASIKRFRNINHISEPKRQT